MRVAAWRAAACALLCLCALHVSAATTATWEMESYQDFLGGKFSGVALDQTGRLTLAPRLDTIFNSGQPAIWSAAQAPDGSIYLGTGNSGRVYRVSPTGASSLVWTADQPEVFAVAAGPAGALYAGTSPDGKVYRIESGKATGIFAPKAKYIWALAIGKDGSLYVGTGAPANIYRIAKNGQSDLYYETGQSHVTSLALDAQGRLLAGTEPNGLLYRISGKGKAFVLYDANLPEIRSIVPMPDGTIYAAALGGSLVSRTGAAAALPASAAGSILTAPTTSITVTDTQAGPAINPKTPAIPAAPAAAAQTVTQAGGITELTGVDKSAVYKINLDNTVETLWSSKDENVYGLAVRPGGDLYLATDEHGRIYRLAPDRQAALVVQTSEGETVRLIQSRQGLLAVTGDVGKLFRIGNAANAAGAYESPVHDSNTVARWGRLRWIGQSGKVSVQTRTGNSARPDNTWSDWSAPLTNPQGSPVTSPNARYIEWRAELMDGATLSDVTLAYLPQNTPPVVRSINVTSMGGASSSKSSPQANTGSNAAYTVTVTDTGEAPAAAGTQTQTLSRGGPGSQIQVSWQADDPDGDRLSYTVYFRAEGETQWLLLKSGITENTLLIDGDALADGRYFFRVVASDRLSNAAGAAREAELVSAPVLIDNTPPVMSIGAPARSGANATVDVEAADGASSLRLCEYSLDAGPWLPVEAADGVTDSQREQFHIALSKLAPGEHLLVVRVYDAAGNAGLAKVMIQ